MAIKNPIQYISRTFNTILSDINSDPELIDKPNWWKRIWSGIGDVFSMWLNAQANNSFLRTAFTRQAVADLLELIDYQLSPQSTASGDLIFYIKGTASFPFTVNIADLAGLTQGGLVSSAKRFESRASKVVSAVSEVITDSEVNTSTDQLTVTSVYTTGEKVRISGASLPSPIVIDTDYYVLYIDDTHIRLATSKANAYAGTYIDITTTGSGNITIALYSFQIAVYQQESKTDVNIGTSDGITEFQEFNLPDGNIIDDTIVITINSILWTKVDSLIDSISTDKHFLLIYNTDNTSFIRFGNDDYGAVPPAFDVIADYSIGGGSGSNVNVIDRVNIYAGADSNIEGVSNPVVFTGGGDPEDIESGKILGPILLKTRDRFITAEDGEALALSYGGLSQVIVNSNTFGVLSTQVIGIATGGGNPSTALKTALQAFLISRTVLESMDVRVQDTTITSTNVTSAMKPLTGYTFTNILPYFRLAWKLFLSEAGQEIKDDFDSNGIASAVILINTIFTESFISTDYDNILPLLENLEPRIIGEDIQESSAIGYLDSYIIGLDYLTITAPIFPITLDDDEITTYGTLTLTEIL